MGETSYDKDSPYRVLRNLIGAERAAVGVVLIYGLGFGLFSLAVPIAAQALVNTITFTANVQPLVVLSIIVFAMLSIASFLRVAQSIIVEWIQCRIFTRVALDLARRIPIVDYRSFERGNATEWLNRFFEVITVQKGLSLILLDGFAVILQSVIGMILLAVYHPILLVFDLILIVAVLAVVLIPLRRGIKTAIDESSAKYKVVSWLEELARDPFIFKFSGAKHFALERTDERVVQYLLHRKSHFRIFIGQIIGTLGLQIISSTLLLGIGSMLVIQGQLSLGQLVAAEIVVTSVVAGVAKFGKYFDAYYGLVAAASKLNFLYSLPLESDDSEKVFPTFSSALELKFKEVSFERQGGSCRFEGLSLHLAPGDRVGIVGANGSGKSTLLELMLGLRVPQAGAIVVNGVDMRQIDLDQLRSVVAVVRKGEVFEGTILDNVRMGRTEISYEQITQALASVDLLEEITHLPEGLETYLYSSGQQLSTGQVQRLAIARAIVGNPKLLVLDEALENIDPIRRVKVIDTLFKADASWTLIMAVQEHDDIRLCNAVYRIDSGVVTQLEGPSR